MSSFNLGDLSALGSPGIFESLSTEAIIAARKGEIVAKAPAYGLAYDVDGLETDPAVILIEEAAYKETLLRARGNDIARARYLHFASGAEVDHLGAFYDTTRMSGEDDARYKGRIILGIQGRSTGGTAPRYRYIAVSSSLRVADAVVYTEGDSPVVHVAVFSADNNGVADADLLATVRAALNASAVRMVSDTINVRSAVVLTQAVTADVWLLPDTPDAVVPAMAAALPGQWQSARGLGRDLTRSWITAKLMGDGIQRVDVLTPAADVTMSPHEAVSIGAVTLNIRGRVF